MARRTSPSEPPPETGEIVDVDVAEEMQESFLEYAYSVIYSRALPDARDGLKPVQRRILFQMDQMGLRPDRGHVKCARVVGEVMGKLHPHGDSAIYDALVRLAQPFSLRVPLIDGHGNFGSFDDGPAAMRYTECRLDPAALLLTTSLDEDVVDMRPNYDGKETEPEVLPAAFPNLLVNGSSGIAVGMATTMAPHNLVEVIAACRHLLAHPDADLAAIMRFIPGPDLPTGGRIVGLDGIRDAYATGRGIFRTRAAVREVDVTARRKGLEVTELPPAVGPEKVIARIKEAVSARKLLGIADVKDLTDRKHGLRLLIEVKSGFVPSAVLEQLYRHTPMEDTFAINNVALVEGQPRTLGLLELVRVYVEHRLEVVRRRCEYRRRRAQERAHIVEGLLIALDAIDEVIQVIRSSPDTATARERLMSVFDLSEIQASHILEMPLRRLTQLEVGKLRDELAALRATIAELTAILDSDARLREVTSGELAEVAKTHGTPRRTVLLEATGEARASSATPLEIPDHPCWVLLSATGRVARTTGREALHADATRSPHDAYVAVVPATARGEVGAVTDRGRLVRMSCVDLPTLPPTANAPSLEGGAPIGEFVDVAEQGRVVALVPLGDPAGATGPVIALATARGRVKRVRPEWPATLDAFDVIGLTDGDTVVGAAPCDDDAGVLVFVADDAQLLRTPAAGVRPQGRTGTGVAGIRLAADARVIAFAVLDATAPADVVTVAGSRDALPGTGGTVKVTPFADYPAKGRDTGGVRCHRFLRGEDVLVAAWAGPGPVRALDDGGAPITLPPAEGRRDGSGSTVSRAIAALGGGTSPVAVPAAP